MHECISYRTQSPHERYRGVLQQFELLGYEEQLTELTTQRERMREIVAKWWTLVEDGH